MLKEIPGAQDVFCGPETVVHLKKGSPELKPETLAKALAALKVECEGVTRNDAAVL